MEGLPFCEYFYPSGERQLSGMESALQAFGKLSAKHLAKHLDRQKESVARVNPVLVIGRKTASRNHAMDVWMDLQILTPGVQNAEESDLSTQVFGIGRNLQQRRGAGAEQKVIDYFLVLQSQPGEFVGDGKNHMHVFNGQQFFFAIGEPSVAGIGLALRTMSRPAGVKRGGFMAALATAIQMSAERCGAAVLNGEEDTEVEPCQPGPVPVDEAVAVRANDVCHLEGWLVHFLCSFRDRFTWSGLESSMLSSGVPAALMWRSER